MTKKNCADDASLDPHEAELITLTLREIRRLLWHLGWGYPPPTPRRVRWWSRWRRRHQAHARRCHYQRRRSVHSKTKLQL
jgi:hypothetical protein